MNIQEALKAAKKSLISEHDIQKSIIEYLQMKRYLTIRLNSGMMSGEYKGKKRFVQFNSEPGCSDILFCQPETGRFGAIEVKKPTWKEPTQLVQDRKTKHHKINPEWIRFEKQRTFLAEVMARGGIGILAKSLKDVTEALTDGR